MLTTLVVKLADPEPYDPTDVDLSEYKRSEERRVGKECA